jgi:hypothetical protein
MMINKRVSDFLPDLRAMKIEQLLKMKAFIEQEIIHRLIAGKANPKEVETIT